LDIGAIVIAGVLNKKSQATPAGVIEACQRRLREYVRSLFALGASKHDLAKTIARTPRASAA